MLSELLINLLMNVATEGYQTVQWKQHIFKFGKLNISVPPHGLK